MTPAPIFHILMTAIILIFITGCMPAESSQSSAMESDTDRQSAYADHPNALYPVRVKEKWGYINRTGALVLQPAWADADDYYEGMAKVAVEEQSAWKYGFIDAMGNWAIAPGFEKAGHFSEGMASVRKNEKWGYIDSEGREAITCQYEDAGHFFNGVAAVKQNGWTGIIDRSGQWILEPTYTVLVGHPRFKEGLAPVFRVDEKTGFVDTTGHWVIPPTFHSAGNFVDGKAWAMVRREDERAEHGFTIRGGYIGMDGQFIIEPQYDFGWDFSDGYAIVWTRSEDKKSKRWQVITPTGDVVLGDLPYRSVGSFHKGLCPVQGEDMKWGFMDISGKIVIPMVYAGVSHFHHGLARMETGSAFASKIVYINVRGEVVWAEK